MEGSKRELMGEKYATHQTAGDSHGVPHVAPKPRTAGINGHPGPSSTPAVGPLAGPGVARPAQTQVAPKTA